MAVKMEPNVKFRKLKSTEYMKRLMTRYFTLAKVQSRLGRKVAWVTSGAPVEPIWAAAMVPIYPENHSAMCAATGISRELCEVAEAKGFCQDLCSYARCDIGSVLSGQGAIRGQGPPKPDLLVACNNICSTVVKWYEVLSEYLQVPLVVVDTPFIHDQLYPHTVRYVRDQLLELVDGIERVTRRPFPWRALQRSASLSLDAVRLWKRVLSLCEHQPAPMTCFDAFIHMAPIVTLRGTRTAIRYYKTLEDELRWRVRNRISPYHNATERIRLLWDNLPIWYGIRDLSLTFARLGAAFVADSYTSAWALDLLQPERSLDSLAETYCSVFLNVSLENRLQQVASLAKRYRADAVVLHSNRSCKPYSFGQYDVARMLQENYGLPSLVLDGDMADPRAFSLEQALGRVEAFLETLE